MREPSDLSEREMAKNIISRTGGSIGELSKLLERAAIWAIKNGKERLTNDELDACGYLSPSQRKDQ